MEKKEYKQPEVKVVELGENIMEGVPQGSTGGFTPADAKRGSLDFGNSFDTEE